MFVKVYPKLLRFDLRPLILKISDRFRVFPHKTKNKNLELNYLQSIFLTFN